MPVPLSAEFDSDEVIAFIIAVFGRATSCRTAARSASNLPRIDRDVDDGELELGQIDLHRPDIRIALLVIDDIAAQRAFDHRPHVADAGHSDRPLSGSGAGGVRRSAIGGSGFPRAWPRSGWLRSRAVVSVEQAS
jgi:hypothetical protein